MLLAELMPLDSHSLVLERMTDLQPDQRLHQFSHLSCMLCKSCSPLISGLQRLAGFRMDHSKFKIAI